MARVDVGAWEARSRPRRRSLVLGGGILLVLALVAVFAPVVAGHDPLAQDPANLLADPSWRHPLGTDHLGRDIWARLVHATRIDLPVAFLAVLAPFCLGTALGLVAGYLGSFADSLFMRIGEVVLAFPFNVLVIALVFVCGSGVTGILIAFTAVGWVSYLIIVRGEVLTEKRQEYVLAARALGYSRRRILLRHLLPNVITQAIVYAMSDIVMTITTIVALGFLGLGIAPPTPEWGSMIADGTEFLVTHWPLATAPGIAVALTGWGFSLLGDGLADLLRVE
ncbi:ABC transporter permease [Amycolatopsis anabasis]|uniref:ABC transporter permease n=1 Tax=Amycolatopsis anabasis TaxID=1840409 RepID=UPI00131E7748|nr:ABC transporter permease [Amycolatopsis anabasis]